MNGRILLFAAVSVVAASCRQEASLPVLSGQPVELAVSVSDACSVRTKATGGFADGEGTVHSVQLFCFDAEAGVLEDYRSSAGVRDTLFVVAGAKRIYAFANCPSLSSVTTEEGLRTAVSELSDNSLSSFVMVSDLGSGAEYDVSGSCELDIAVRRMVAKVQVDRISAAFESPSLQELDFFIRKIYLTDVAGNCTYGMSAGPSEFCSGDDDNGDSVNAMICESGLDYNLGGNGHTDVRHGFYVYPNGTDTKTAVVIEGEINGVAQRYSFDLPSVERNCVYDITDIRLTSLSSELASIELDLTVTEWEDTETETYIY